MGAGRGGAAMTKRLPCPPAPGPLEDYAAQFDPLFRSLAQRRGLRAYLQGLLLPRDRNKTLTGLAGAEPVVGAQHAAVQGLQFFLSEATWGHERVHQGGGASQTTTATQNTAPATPPPPPASIWGRWARSTTASSVSPACGPQSGSTGPSPSSPRLRRRGSRRGRAVRSVC